MPKCHESFSSLKENFDKNFIDNDGDHSLVCLFFLSFSPIGKAKRLKQAKDEATEEIEKYRGEREKQFKDFEVKVC